ncbi:MaoC family dehydratase [Teredinibacter turnerae]|uniref:MaoC family dehydratase n=1 Tax=Teredinibacter turnerae TaxID=2426 RepID=UPI000374E498|nr:MaoC family dehydratase [Teredinibacter turnerae]
MNIVELLKEKGQQLQLSNGEFIRRLEPQVRELKESLNQSVSNSFASAFFSRFIAVANEELHPAVVPLPAVVELASSLRRKLGQEVHLGDWQLVDQSMIDSFAQATGDAQWIHTDPVRAERESPFKSTIAHGFLIVSLLPKMRGLEEYAKVHYPNSRMVVNCGMNDLRFITPVKSGSRLRSRTYLRKYELNKRSIDLTEEVIVDIELGRKEACRVELLTRVYL